MDLTRIYIASPDWIKALMLVLPCLTLYATARLFTSSRPPPRLPPPPFVRAHENGEGPMVDSLPAPALTDAPAARREVW